MNGCRGASGTATGRCVAGVPENTGSEPASGPSGIGCGGTAAAGAAASRNDEDGEERRPSRREGSRVAARSGAGYCTARRLCVLRRSARRPLAGRTAWSHSSRITPSTADRSAEAASP